MKVDECFDGCFVVLREQVLPLERFVSVDAWFPAWLFALQLNWPLWQSDLSHLVVLMVGQKGLEGFPNYSDC